jgi:hypothetical protein
MTIDLINDEIELLYYCLEQQEYEFNLDEQKLCNQIIEKFTDAQSNDSTD